MRLSKLVVSQVRSLLNNEKSLPKGGRAADKIMGEYEAIVAKLERVNSQFVEVKSPVLPCRTPRVRGSTNFNTPYDNHLLNT